MHVIHLVDGRLSPKSKTSRADVTQLVQSALASNAPSGIVVHFHGGLVSENSGRTSAEKALYPLYADRSKGYPVFFIWESGFWEAPFNNLKEIVREKLFQEFVKKVAEWALKKLPGALGLKGGAGASVNEAELREQFDEWFRGARSAPPDQVQKEPILTDDAISRTRGSDVSELGLEEEVIDSIEGDPAFKQAAAEVYNGLYPATATRTRSRGGGTDASATSMISKEAAEELFPRGPAGTRALTPLEWYRFAKAIVKIVIRVVRRVRSGRGHGTYVTIVEEILRQVYVDKIGRLVWWERMKSDTADAFRDGPEYGGTAFLTELQTQLKGVATPPTITLVGHSTGAVYICNLLAKAAEVAPDIHFNVIFEAPAATHDLLAATAQAHGSRISNFRQFGMSDAREAGDVLVPILYTHSLLYFVSGLLESEPDEPLIGMSRFVENTAVYDPDSFPSVETCRRFYARYPKGLVWSPCSGGPGFDCDGKKHGDFDDVDAQTLGSVQHILQYGF